MKLITKKINKKPNRDDEKSCQLSVGFLSFLKWISPSDEAYSLYWGVEVGNDILILNGIKND